MKIPTVVGQLVENGSGRFLYNIGAKKYAAFNADGSITLTDASVSLNLKEGSAGIEVNGGGTQWGFVRNDLVGTATNISDINRQESDNIGTTSYFTLDGKANSRPQKGINIVRSSSGQVRKILVK